MFSSVALNPVVFCVNKFKLEKMNNKDKKIARPFDGEHKIGIFEIVILGIIILIISWGIYYFGTRLIR
jgi:hypothetical protein